MIPLIVILYFSILFLMILVAVRGVKDVRKTTEETVRFMTAHTRRLEAINAELVNVNLTLEKFIEEKEK